MFSSWFVYLWEEFCLDKKIFIEQRDEENAIILSWKISFE